MKRIKLIFNAVDDVGDYSLWVNNEFKGIHRVSGLNFTLTASLEKVITATQAKTIQWLMETAITKRKTELHTNYCRVGYTALVR